MKTRVAILRGGPSSEFEVSLKSGKAVIDNLDEELFYPIDIFIDKSGVWHKGGVPIAPDRALTDADVVFNALHGTYGEDGKVQQILDQLQIPYTGSGALASALGMSKELSKRHFEMIGVKTPYYKTVTVSHDLDNELAEIFKTMPHPSVVKPNDSGSSVGVSIVQSFDDLRNAVASAFEHSNKVIIEEYINGKEGTAGVVENLRDHEFYPLVPIEIRKKTHIFDYKTKYEDDSVEICPGDFSKEEKAEIEKLSVLIHKAFGLRHYSRFDFIVHPKRGIFVLEVNTLPGLTEASLVPKALKAVGVKFSDFIHHLINLAIGRK